MKFCDAVIYTCRYSYLKFHYEPIDKDRIMKDILFFAIDARGRFNLQDDEVSDSPEETFSQYSEMS